MSEPTRGSSRAQSLSQIPYEDVISAHSVNTFVPLVLVRKLPELLADRKAATDHGSGGEAAGTNAAAGYIVNVPSREGIFKSSRDNSAKRATTCTPTCPRWAST